MSRAGSAGKCPASLAPSVPAQPQSQIAEYSGRTALAVGANGSPTLTYQSFFGTNALPGATNALLSLTNLSFAEAGDYFVVVTNGYGSATGGPAVLTVVDTVPPTLTTCASNRTLSASAQCSVVLPDLTGELAAWDASGPVFIVQDPPAGTQIGLGATFVIFTVRVSSGNSARCSATITVVDTTPPTVLDCVTNLVLEFSANCQALLPDLTGTNYLKAFDDCGTLTVAQTPPTSTEMSLGTNIVLLTLSNAATNQTTRMVAVIVPGEPVVSVQPTNLSVPLSSNAVFSVVACGVMPLAYQWHHSATNMVNATNATLILDKVETNDAGDYHVLITNSAGAITSAVATLTVLRPPVITRQPKSLAAAPGGTASFSVSVQGRVRHSPISGKETAHRLPVRQGHLSHHQRPTRGFRRIYYRSY